MNQLFTPKNRLALLLAIRAQNGRLLSQQPVVYPDSIRAFRLKAAPRFEQVFAQTQTLAITYRSNGLKIQGYVVQPVAPGRYPCVSYCRGGHEEVGQLDLWTISALADIAHHDYVVIASQLRGTPGSEGQDALIRSILSIASRCWRNFPKLIPVASASTASAGAG
jgi:hypothetical protein